MGNKKRKSVVEFLVRKIRKIVSDHTDRPGLEILKPLRVRYISEVLFLVWKVAYTIILAKIRNFSLDTLSYLAERD